eukprot:8570476-Alexandrium_andersonii.AAC.1
MGGPSRPVLLHHRTTASDNDCWISTLQAAANRSHKQVRVRSSWSACQRTPMPSNRERTTSALPVVETGRGTGGGA